MLTVDEALAAILREVQPFPADALPLTDALGLVLTEDVISDVDSPPFDKSLMDGFALRSADISKGSSRFDVVEEITAGQTASRPVEPGQAIRIMTGAPLPQGADLVVPVEETEFDQSSGIVQVDASKTDAGSNILRQGTAMNRGECVVPAGRCLRPQELAALAELGRARVPARQRPTVAVLATGDELVPVSDTPGPGQIRNSNETMLVAQIRRAGADPVPLGIARDEPDSLNERIAAGLQCDLLLLSGGVSAGTKDLVPLQLAAAGVGQVFHKVSVKPGKPVWFGVLESSADGRKRFVFGLPGNPVSSMVCFELFVRTAIRRLMGVPSPIPQPVRARLAIDHSSKGSRPTYHPSLLEWTAEGPMVRPVRWHGSADLRATVDANSMAFFPPGETCYPEGTPIDVILWDE